MTFTFLQVISIILILPPLVELGGVMYKDASEGNTIYLVHYTTPLIRATAMVCCQCHGQINSILTIYLRVSVRILLNVPLLTTTTFVQNQILQVNNQFFPSIVGGCSCDHKVRKKQTPEVHVLWCVVHVLDVHGYSRSSGALLKNQFYTGTGLYNNSNTDLTAQPILQLENSNIFRKTQN